MTIHFDSLHLTHKDIPLLAVGKGMTAKAVVSIHIEVKYLELLMGMVERPGRALDKRVSALYRNTHVSEIRLSLQPSHYHLIHNGAVTTPLLVELCYTRPGFKIKVQDWQGKPWSSDYFLTST